MTHEVNGISKSIVASTETDEETDGRKRFIAVAGDISQPETGAEFVAKTIEAFGGRLDIFVSNAGVCQFEEFLQYVKFTLSMRLVCLGEADVE